MIYTRLTEPDLKNTMTKIILLGFPKKKSAIIINMKVTAACFISCLFSCPLAFISTQHLIKCKMTER